MPKGKYERKPRGKYSKQTIKEVNPLETAQVGTEETNAIIQKETA